MALPPPTASPSPNAANLSVVACPWRLRLLHWNLQQKAPKAPTTAEGGAEGGAASQLRGVLAYAQRENYDALTLNELALDERTVGELAAAHGYAHARLLRAAHRTRLGIISRAPLTSSAELGVPRGGARDATTIGHGMLCARIDGWPALCLTHLTAAGERKRAREAAAALTLLPSEPHVLLGDLNVISPLEIAPPLSALRASRVLRTKYLDSGGVHSAAGAMRALLAAGWRDVAHLSGGDGPTLRRAPRATPSARRQAWRSRFGHARARAPVGTCGRHGRCGR